MANRHRIRTGRQACRSIVIALGLLAATAATAGQSLQTVRDSVERFVRSEYAELGTITEVDVSKLDPRLRLAACDEPLTPFTPNGQRRLGNVTVGIRCDGARPWTLYVPVRIVSSVKIMTASRALPRGNVLSEQDLAAVERDAGALPYGYFTDSKQLIGQRLRRTIRPGDVLSPAMVEPAPVIARGQTVWIAGEAGGISVRMKGEALTDGAVGERIRVRNLSSRRVLQVEVINANLVKVPL